MFCNGGGADAILCTLLASVNVNVNVHVCRQWVPPDYYDTPLEERARELGSDPQQLCKTMIMENKAFDEVLVAVRISCLPFVHWENID